MSILRKIPKIEQVLDTMSIESLKRLESLMNSGNGATETYTLFGGENKLNYENKDLGVWYCNIELERNKSVETGFLIWESSTKALFISYDISQCLKEYEIDLTTYTYVKINEKLSIEEFRRVLEDNINKEVVHIDTTGNVEIGKNLVVDGKVILNGKEDLVDTSGNMLISDSGGGSSSGSRVFEPTISGVSISNDDTYKQLTIVFNVSNFEIITYLTTLIENNKPFTETFYLKTPANSYLQMMFNTPLSLVNSTTSISSIMHCFYVKTEGTDINGIVSYDGNNMTLDLIFSSEEGYTGYKQLASALFTNDTKIKITIKTDE